MKAMWVRAVSSSTCVCVCIHLCLHTPPCNPPATLNRDPLSVPRHLPNASAAIMYNVAASQGPAITNAATPGTGAGGRGSVALLSRPGQLVGSGSRKLPAGGTPSMVG